MFPLVVALAGRTVACTAVAAHPAIGIDELVEVAAAVLVPARAALLDRIRVCAVSYPVEHVLAVRAPGQRLGIAVVERVAIKVPSLHPLGARSCVSLQHHPVKVDRAGMTDSDDQVAVLETPGDQLAPSPPIRRTAYCSAITDQISDVARPRLPGSTLHVLTLSGQAGTM